MKHDGDEDKYGYVRKVMFIERDDEAAYKCDEQRGERGKNIYDTIDIFSETVPKHHSSDKRHDNHLDDTETHLPKWDIDK